jgi:UPF0716 protein FxsA
LSESRPNCDDKPVRTDLLVRLVDRTNLFRFFSNLLGLSVLLLVDGWILIRVARHFGIYLALALEAIPALAAFIIVGGSIHRHLVGIAGNVREGRYDPNAYGTLFTGIAAGVLLVLPGFATDALGLLLYVVPSRFLFVRLIVARLGDQLSVIDEHVKLMLAEDDADARG